MPYDGCSYIVLPCCGQPVAIVALLLDEVERGAASNELSVTSVAPRCSTSNSVVTNPPIQKNGIDEKITSSGPIGYPDCRLQEWRTTVPCVWIAPFGSAVLPEL